VKTQNCVVVAGSECLLSKKISELIDSKVIVLEKNSFADSEIAIQFDGDAEYIRGKTVLLVQQFSFDEIRSNGINSINDQLTRFLLLSHQIKAYGARRIIAVLPYLPYIRQSRSFCGTYVGPLEVLGRFFKSAGVDRVVSCDLHEALCHSLFSIPIYEMKLADFWKQQLGYVLNNDDIRHICFISPDRGGINRVKEMAYTYGVDWAFVEKKRINRNKSQSIDVIGNVRDKIAVIIDDIIDSGDTAVGACNLLIERGVRRVVGCFSHAIFSGNAIQKIERSGFEKIIVSNSILSQNMDLSKKIIIASLDKVLSSFVQKVTIKDMLASAEKVPWQKNCTTEIKSEQL
jgi:ribose-phosphate pyrophosphokinase